MAETARLGGMVRALRRRQNMRQSELAERLGISASYLNLIEHNRRPLPGALLIRIAQLFQVDVRALSGDDEHQLVSDLLEAFSDDLFEGQGLTAAEVQDLARTAPTTARAVRLLYQAYRESRQAADVLAARLSAGQELAGLDGSRLPSEEVSDLLQRRTNYFPELEEEAERLWHDAGLDFDDIYTRMAAHLERMQGVRVRVDPVHEMRHVMRRYEPDARLLRLSEALPRGSRNFQLAHQIGLVVASETLDRLVRDEQLTTDESQALARVALANYFAAAVLMPYGPFLDAARSERYDIELLGHRFSCSFEQVCHRLTTLRRPGAEGIPFHFLRIDIAGNISKRFSASGIRFARFSAGCPRWNVYAAFLTPGMIRVQVSRMPDGTTYLSVARTLRRDRRFRTPYAVQAVELGCDIRHARELVYGDGIDLENLEAAVPVGVSCRVCERMDCEQRAFPALHHPLHVNQNVRGLSFYAPAPDAG